MISRRTILTGAGAGAGLLLSGCDRIGDNPQFSSTLLSANDFTYKIQRSLQDRMALAPEFSPAQMSPHFRSNGNTMPESDDYAGHVEEKFAYWALDVKGMVRQPLSLSLDQLRTMPTRTQITAHNCVEGWTAIAKWHGVPLGSILRQAQVSPLANFIVFHCADDFDGAAYYESIDMVDAFHPQTILAWGMNDRMLPVENGAPLRLRVERQLGYKQAKYVMGIEAVGSLAPFGKGRGGYWEDAINYEWYAGL